MLACPLWQGEENETQEEMEEVDEDEKPREKWKSSQFTIAEKP